MRLDEGNTVAFELLFENSSLRSIHEEPIPFEIIDKTSEVNGCPKVRKLIPSDSYGHGQYARFFPRSLAQ